MRRWRCLAPVPDRPGGFLDPDGHEVPMPPPRESRHGGHRVRPHRARNGARAGGQATAIRVGMSTRSSSRGLPSHLRDPSGSRRRADPRDRASCRRVPAPLVERCADQQTQRGRVRGSRSLNGPMAVEARGPAAILCPAATTAIDSSAASTLTRAWLTCTTRPPDGVNPKRSLKAAQGSRIPVMCRHCGPGYMDA